MADVSFNEEPTALRYATQAKQPLLVRMVLATKIVSTQKQAEYVLIGIAAFCIVLAIVFWPKGRPAADPSTVPPVAGPSDGRILNR